MSGITENLMRIPALFEGSAPLVRRSARAQITLLLEIGEERKRLLLDRGTLRIGDADGPMDGWDIALRAAPEVWADHWSALPRPDASDILGMARHGRMRIEGNFLPLMRHLQLVKDIIALPRRQS